MDTSEQYIKMCEKAEEIQNDWRPQVGECFAMYSKDDIRVKIKPSMSIHYVCKNEQDWSPNIDMNEIEDSFDYWLRWNVIDSEGNRINPSNCRAYYDLGGQYRSNNAIWDVILIWLPRQDRLQEMIIKNDLGGLVHKWECFIDRQYRNRGLLVTSPLFEFKTMEQLWLAFVMKEKYGKVWDGDNWRP